MHRPEAGMNRPDGDGGSAGGVEGSGSDRDGGGAEEMVVEPEPVPAAAARRPARGRAHLPATEDRSDSMPDGCTLRRYDPEDKAPFWLGRLPDGRCDDNGTKSRTRAFREGLKSESDARSEIELWLIMWS